MRTIAFHTLGCKVNQYDTQAMQELLEQAGYLTVPFTDPADIYLVNTCTVTGTGDRKSLQLARKLKREHPESRLILCGCMAQQQPETLLRAGADLVLGTQRRGEIVPLLEQVLREGKPLCAVEPLGADVPFEPLSISAQSGHTRATLKIQEGCDNRCSYCIIPQVRGPVRSRPAEDIRAEAARLCRAGYREIVLTGIHLTSYGRDTGGSLLDAIRAVHEVPGLLRIRLGSLEPSVATRDFIRELKGMERICPQFHLALQSGSDSVLRRMRRRYNTAQYLRGVENIRELYPDAALTTDVLTGFPGETEAEFQETEAFLRKVGYARIHVFPYSARPGTKAALLPGALSRQEKERRARRLIAVGAEMARDYMVPWVGKAAILLPEEKADGAWEGYTPEYIRVRLGAGEECAAGVPVRVRLKSVLSHSMSGEIIQSGKDE